MNVALESVNYPLPSIQLTAQSAGVAQVVYVGQNLTDGWVKIYNEAPFQLLATDGAGRTLHEVSAQAIDAFQLPPGVKMFTITPLQVLPFAAPSYTIRMSVFPYGPPPGAYPQALARQSAPTSSAAPSGFTASFNFNTANANEVILNVFNPLTSGVNMNIYSARAVFSPNTAPTANVFAVFAYQTGADNNYATAVTPVANNVVNTSKMHATATAAGSIAIPTQGWEFIEINFATTQPFPYEAIPFDDKKQVSPGTQAMLYVQNLPAGGGTGLLVMKYTEQ